ncbi:MAG: hypothetical protein ACXABY_21810 [Candidatus Thorarchaeota archaeon]|jgi:hypothetical protein
MDHKVEWHTVGWEYEVVTTWVVVFLVSIIPISALVLLFDAPVIVLILVTLALLVGFVVSIRFEKRIPHIVGLAREVIVLRYRRRNAREIRWTEISRCSFPQDRKGSRIIVTNSGEFILLPVDEELGNNILSHWKKTHVGNI